MNKHSVSLIVALLATAVSASATISVSLVADQLQGPNGAPLSRDSLVLLIVSTTNATFEPIAPGSATSVGSPLFSSETPGDDYIVYRTFITQDEADFSPGLLFKQIDDANGGALNFSTVPGWNPGDPLALIWFPTLTGSSSLITANTRYGQYTNSLAFNGSEPWITPADGTSNYPLRFFTSDAASGEQPAGPTNPAIAGRASLVVAPEPGSAVLAGVGLATLLGRRRRR